MSRNSSEDLVPSAVGIDLLGAFEVPDGAANVVQEALGLHVGVA